MLLSIIIPVYNVQNYIERCVNSVIGENTEDIEIILVDDGSTDSSPVLCDGYADKYKYVKVIHQCNGGLSAARNTGIFHAKGEYLFFLDSDDMVEKSFVCDILNVIRIEKPDMISFMCCNEYRYNEYEIAGNKSIHSSFNIEYFNRILTNKMGSQICFHVYKKSIFDDIKFPDGCFYEDIRIFWKLIENSEKIIDIDYTYYIYNLSNQSSITKSIDIKRMYDMKCSIDIMINGIIDSLKTKKMLDEKMSQYAYYARLNGYVYIAFKIKSLTQDSFGLRDELENYIKSAHVNLIRYRSYDWKKYLFCKMMIFARGLKYGR